MSESLGSAVLDLSADGSGLEEGLSNAEGTTKSRMGRIGGMIGSVVKASAKAFTVVGIAATVAGFKTAAYGDELDKASARAGVSVELVPALAGWAR